MDLGIFNLFARRPNVDKIPEAIKEQRNAAIAYLNVVGGQDALVFDGASVVADGDGTVHPAAAAFVDQWLHFAKATGEYQRIFDKHFR